MTNLNEKARAGRIEALKTRTARLATSASMADNLARIAAERRNEMPIFISSRARPEVHAFLH